MRAAPRYGAPHTSCTWPSHCMYVAFSKQGSFSQTPREAKLRAASAMRNYFSDSVASFNDKFDMSKSTNKYGVFW